MKNWLLILIVGVGIWALTKFRAGQSLTFRAGSVSFDGAQLLLNLGITNHSDFPVSFESFSGSVSSNGMPLGTVQDFIPAVLAPNMETTLQFQVNPSISNLAQLIKNIFTTNQQQDLRLDGTVRAEGVQFPVSTVFQTIPAIA